MIRKITLTLFSLFTALGFSQTDIASSSLFSSGPVAWPYVFTACTVNDGNQGEQQTLAINITSLPSAGANYQVYKTTANGSDFFANAQPLSLGLNTINVNAVSFARAVKFRFDSGDICFDSLELNPTSDTNEDPCISNSSLFTSGSAQAWPYVFTACTADDGNSGEAQTLEINIISLPEEGANYRVAKTTANGNFFFSSPEALSLGPNTLTVNSVTFARTVRFQFDSGDICFDSLDLNNQSVLSSTTTDIYNLSIYPNPTKSVLFTEGSEDLISLELFSISGRPLMQVINTNQLDISSFPNGVYFLKVNDGTTSVIKKIIKQ